MKAFELYENCDLAPLGIFATLTAGGAGDNTEVLAATGFDTRDVHSLVLGVYARHTIAATKKLSVTVKVAESDDNTVFDAQQTLANAALVASGVSTNGEALYELRVDIRGLIARKRFLRFSVTPDLDAAATDTATIAAFVLTGGARSKPVTH